MNENGLTAPGIGLSRNKTRVYLDSTVLAALFGREDEKWKMARALLQDGSEGRIEVVVSALTLVECEVPAGPAGADMLSELFENEWVVQCNVDPFVADTARRLRTQCGGISTLTPNLWLHAATALWEKCQYLMTYDKRLLKLSGQRALELVQVVAPSRPWDTGQMSLVDIEGVMPESSNPALRRSLII